MIFTFLFGFSENLRDYKRIQHCVNGVPDSPSKKGDRLAALAKRYVYRCHGSLSLRLVSLKLGGNITNGCFVGFRSVAFIYSF